MRWDGDTIRIIGSWSSDSGPMETVGRVYRLRRRHGQHPGRAHRPSRPRVNSAEDLRTDFATETLGGARLAGDDRRADPGRRQGLGRRHGVAH
jgi:hypothetical protein